MEEAMYGRMTAGNSDSDTSAPVLWEHRCPDGVGGCTAISVDYLSALMELLRRVSKTRHWQEEATYLLKIAAEHGEPEGQN